MAYPEETKTMKPSTGTNTYNYDTLTGAATITDHGDDPLQNLTHLGGDAVLLT